MHTYNGVLTFLGLRVFLCFEVLFV